MKNNSHYILSISDLLMGFLFVFILILLKFIIDYHNKKDDLSKPLIERAKLLNRLKKKFKRQNIKVKIDIENGTFELPEILCFPKNKYELSEKQKKGLEKVCGNFSEIICHADLKKTEEKYAKWRIEWKDSIPSGCKKQTELENRPDCKESTNGLIDTILIEGHADSTPIGGYPPNTGIKTNLDLAMKRAQTVFRFLTQYKEAKAWDIAQGNHFYYLLNEREKSLFGVTSYGSLRSSDQRNNRKPNSSSEKERCISIRFIMSQPDDIQRHLKKNLKQGKTQ